MKMRCSFGNSLFVGLELIHVFESLSPGRFKALLLRVRVRVRVRTNTFLLAVLSDVHELRTTIENKIQL